MVGVDRLKKPGENVRAGDALCRVHVADAARMGEALICLHKAFEIEGPS
jgi:thymidine phosphorylase